VSKSLGLACALIAAVLSLALAGTASAALTHPVATEFTTGAGCAAEDMAVWDAGQRLYVVCLTPEGQRTIKRFDLNGNPAPFSAEEPYIEGNTITYNPGTENKAFGSANGIGVNMEISVDNSSANNGYLYATGNHVLQGGETEVFGPSGKWLTAIETFFGGATGNDVDASGSVYTTANGAAPHIDRYDTNYKHDGIMNKWAEGDDYLRADSTGAVWAGRAFNGHFLTPQSELVKYEADQFRTSHLTVIRKEEGDALHLSEPIVSPNAANPLLPGGFYGFDIDPTNDDLVVDRGEEIQVYSKGTPDVSSFQDNPSFGSSVLVESRSVAVGANREVFAGSGTNTIVKFAPGDILPDILTLPAQVDDVGHASAVVRAQIKLVGGAPVNQCQLEYGPTTAYHTGGSPPPDSGVVPCSPDPSVTNFTEDTEVSAAIPGPNPALHTGSAYHYRFVAGNVHGTNAGNDRSVSPVAVLKLHTNPADIVDEHNVTFNGSFDPDGLETKYFFEYGLDSTYGQSTSVGIVAAASGVQPVTASIGTLPAGRSLHYRIVARNSLGTTFGQDVVFRTASKPDVSGVRADSITAESATVKGRVNPVGYATKYHFEYGTTPEYGSSIPVPDTAIGSGGDPVDVAEQIQGLESGITYHFRLVATNQWGSAFSPDSTIDFAPPTCPNSHVRQQTRSGYLPDCRAYELVSPPEAGSILVQPTGSIDDLDLGPCCNTRYGKLWPVNTGIAAAPTRFAYYAGFGAFEELEGTNAVFDMYMATRTPTGWVTSLPGLKGSEALMATRPQCSNSLSLCIENNDGDPFYFLAEPENAAHLFKADGQQLTRLPTNVNTVPDGAHYVGDQKFSGDGNHYVFSANNRVFAPNGTTSAPGSAYDNDIAAKTVNLVSLRQDGTPIPQDVVKPGEFIEFAGLSNDGSHILMDVKGGDGPVHLYMRVDDAVTYDVSRGAGVTFVGMTEDGSKVFFTAAQPLTPDDHDQSVDLYMWSEAGNQLTRISQGNGRGDTDLCSPSWGSQCNVLGLSTEDAHPWNIASIPGIDDSIASQSGDVYFYSPELLDPESPGVQNARNLYVYRNGAVHLVATLDAGAPIIRMQISPDGRHAAFLTASSLTAYDTHGFRQMYTYDAETGRIECASCRPDGEPPTADVVGSQGGPFMANDGRTFFASSDQLTPQDTDGILDVYEYAGGRPQLISQGTGSRDFTGGSQALQIVGGTAFTGLESVSADGTDVFFSTYDSLVPQDHNGEFIKMYDARSGGGFDIQPNLGPCAAADECHGPGSNPPAPPGIGTGSDLGDSGNVQSAPAKKKGRAHHKRHRQRHHKSPAGGRHG
jgi:hypothetical protein